MSKPSHSSVSAIAQTNRLSVCILASGSRGNSIYISNGSTSVLVDAGLSGIEIERRLASQGLSPESLDAILVTHEHSDHVSGVGVMARRYDLPVHISSATLNASTAIGRINKVINFSCGQPFRINDLEIHPFSISHDACDPSGFTIQSNGCKIGIATDLGIATAMVKTHLSGSSLLILEANHDPDMLETGPYPWPLKQRIRSRSGHLSNKDSATLLQELAHDKLQHIILAHLSEENNLPALAQKTVMEALPSCCASISVASQYKSSKIFRLP